RAIVGSRGRHARVVRGWSSDVCSSDLGGTIARAVHGQGAVVAISGTRREALDALATELGDRLHVLPCDLADMAQVEKLVPDAEQIGRASCRGREEVKGDAAESHTQMEY